MRCSITSYNKPSSSNPKNQLRPPRLSSGPSASPTPPAVASCPSYPVSNASNIKISGKEGKKKEKPTSAPLPPPHPTKPPLVPSHAPTPRPLSSSPSLHCFPALYSPSSVVPPSPNHHHHHQPSPLPPHSQPAASSVPASRQPSPRLASPRAGPFSPQWWRYSP